MSCLDLNLQQWPRVFEESPPIDLLMGVPSYWVLWQLAKKMVPTCQASIRLCRANKSCLQTTPATSQPELMKPDFCVVMKKDEERNKKGSCQRVLWYLHASTERIMWRVFENESGLLGHQRQPSAHLVSRGIAFLRSKRDQHKHKKHVGSPNTKRIVGWKLPWSCFRQIHPYATPPKKNSSKIQVFPKNLTCSDKILHFISA